MVLPLKNSLVKLRINRFLLWAIVAGWTPYLGLTLYWRHLIATVQGADHGELSGPVQYFLPRLLMLALVMSVTSISALVVRSGWIRAVLGSLKSGTEIGPNLSAPRTQGDPTERRMRPFRTIKQDPSLS